MRRAVISGLFLTLYACSPPSTGQTDVLSLDATNMDATAQGMDGGSPTLDSGSREASVCVVGTAPTMLPMVRSEFVILGTGDAGTMFPSGAGGDSNLGTFVVSSVRVYLPARAAGLLLPNESSLQGTGWISADGTTFRMALDMELRLATSEQVGIGTILRPVQTRVRGSYTVQNGRILVIPASDCAASTGMENGMASLSFSRDAPDRARLFVLLAGVMGESMLEFTLERPR